MAQELGTPDRDYKAKVHLIQPMCVYDLHSLTIPLGPYILLPKEEFFFLIWGGINNFYASQTTFFMLL